MPGYFTMESQAVALENGVASEVDDTHEDVVAHAVDEGRAAADLEVHRARTAVGGRQCRVARERQSRDRTAITDGSTTSGEATSNSEGHARIVAAGLSRT